MGNFDLERKILTCLLNPREDIKSKGLVFLKVHDVYFYHPLHRELYAVIRGLYESKQPYDVVDLIIKHRHDDEMYTLLVTISDENGKNLYILYESDIDKLINCYNLTYKIAETEHLIKKVKTLGDESSALSELSEGISAIAKFDVTQKSGLVSIQDAICNMLENPSEGVKIKTNIPSLNAFLNGGFEAGSLATFVAQPRMGKTFFSIYLMDSILQANPNTQGLFFSLEMPIEQIIKRHAALKANRIFDCLNDEQKERAFIDLMRMDYKICDLFTASKANDLAYIKNYARIEHAQKPVSVIVIDYMTKIDTSERHDRDDLKYKAIASELANLAVELKCVIINLMHSNRTPSERPPNERCPQLTDETQSQGAGTSSGYFFGIDRPELHGDDDDWQKNYKNLFVLACRKSRFCPEFVVATQFNSGLFQSPFCNYTPKVLSKKGRSPEDF